MQHPVAGRDHGVDAGAGAGSDLPDVHYYAELLWRSRALIATAVAVGLGLGVFVGFMQTPEYQATTLLEINPPTPVLMSVSDAMVGGGYWQNADYYNTQFRILRSPTLGAEAVDRLKLADRPPFLDHPDPGGLFVGSVSVSPLSETRLVSLSVRHADPEAAALWANTLAGVYVERTLTGRIDTAQRANDWLHERLENTQEQMRSSQERLFRSYEGQDLFVPEGSVSAVSSSIGELNSDLVGSQRRRIQLQAAFQQIAEMQRRGDDLGQVPQVVADAAVSAVEAKLASLRVEESQLRERYRPAHPEIQRLLARREELVRARAERVSEVVGGLRVEFEQLRRSETEIRTAIEAERSRASDQGRKLAELEALRREADSAKGLYDVLLERLNETDIARSVRANTVAVVERALPPQKAIFPDERRFAGIGLLLGLVLGVGLVVARELLDNSVRSMDDVERFLHCDLLASVPRYDERSVARATEAYQQLRTALLFSRSAERTHTVLVVSSAPQEGKTTTVVNLGKLLAASGEKTLIVDADLRRPQVHERLGLGRERGLADCFAWRKPPRELVRRTRVPNLFVLSAGTIPPSPPALLGSPRFGDLLAEVRDDFEWILLDSPPLAAVTDGLLLARHANMTVLVVRHNAVDKYLVRRSLSALAKRSTSLVGVVLNDVSPSHVEAYYGELYGPQAVSEDAADEQPDGRAA